MIKVTAVGGYGEVGRNMTLITVDDESVIFDMGMHMDHLLTHVEGNRLSSYSAEEMIKLEVVPDDSIVDKAKVIAIVPSHAHLDHIAAIPFLAGRYNCPIYGTPFTCEVLKRQYADNKFKLNNKIVKVQENGIVKLSDKLKIEFVHVTHSTPHTSILVLHTPYGQVVYGNDFKLDDEPVLGLPPNYERLKSLGKVKVLLNECLYARRPGRTPFEIEAKRDLEKICAANSEKGIFITTFTSHIARLASIVKIAQALNRKVLCFGRSLDKYMGAAKKAGVSNIIDEVEMVPFKNQMKRRINKMSAEDKKKYVIVITGHQAEEQAVLNSFTNGVLPNPFSPEDLLIFSCNTIPTDAIIKARAELESKLKSMHLRIYTDIHSSGHSSQEDLMMLLDMTNPQFVVPAHGTDKMMNEYEKLALSHGFKGKIKKIHSGESFDAK